MKYVFLCVCLISLAAASCTKVTPEPDPGKEPAGDQLAQAVIGPKGGKLEAEDFILVVPEGAFNTTITLSLYLEENDSARLVNQVTSSYRLTGLDHPWDKPLEVSIRFDGELDEGSYISFAFAYYEEEYEDAVQIHEFYEASDSLGFLKCVLPPVKDLESSLKSTLQFPPLYQDVTFHNYLMVRGMFKVGTVKSDYAEITYDMGVDLEKVTQFASDLEEAVMLFHTLGFLDANLFTGDLKLRVQIIDEENSERRATYCKPDFDPLKGVYLQGRNHFTVEVVSLYTIKIPVKYFLQADSKELRKIAGQGVFQFGSYCRLPEETNWVGYAFRTWVDDYFYGSNSIPLNETRIMHPFYGFNIINMDDYLDIFPNKYYLKRHIYHGICMSPMISFLMDQVNPDLDLMAKIYDKMVNPDVFNQPIDAMPGSVATPVNQWWPDFIKAYLEGSIRDIPGEMFLDKIDAGDQMHFMDETDTVKYFERSYPDFSAKLCQLNLSKNLSESVLGESDYLKFEVGPEQLDLDYVRVLVYGYKDEELEFLSQGKEVTIDHLKERMEQGYETFLAVVVNSLSEAPYLEEVDIDLTVQIIKEKKWPWSYLAVQVVVTDAILRAKDGTEYTWNEYQYKIPDKEMKVSEEGTRFTTDWLEQDANYKYEGGMEITLDKETFEITSFYLWSNSESFSEGKVTQTEKTQIRGKEGTVIPMVYSDDVYCYHQLEGEEVCPAIQSYTYEYTMYPGESYEQINNLVSYSCLEDAQLIFYWASRPIGILSTNRP